MDKRIDKLDAKIGNRILEIREATRCRDINEYEEGKYLAYVNIQSIIYNAENETKIFSLGSLMKEIGECINEIKEESAGRKMNEYEKAMYKTYGEVVWLAMVAKTESI